MTRFVAFLRAINVGGRVVKMDRLRALFEGLRLREVETFIASGNVLFRAPAGDAATLERRIERHLADALGYEVANFLRTPAEIAAVAAHEPFGRPDPTTLGHTLSVAFLKEAPDARTRDAIVGGATEIDEFAVHGREVYWRCRVRTSESTFSGARLERVLGAPATVRNVTTVRRLALREGGPEGAATS